MLTVLIRSVVLYLCIMLFMRLMGKRQLGELQPAELVISVLISNIVSLPVEDPNVPLLMGIIPVAMLVGLELIVSVLSLRFRSIRTLMGGNPVVIIHNGVIDQGALKTLRFSIDDLMESLRSQGIFDLSQIQYAIVETNGTVSILPYEKDSPATPTQLKLTLAPREVPVVVISDGMVLEDGLRGASMSRKQLNRILEKEQVSVRDVFLFSADKSHRYTLIQKENKK
ncbi:MAG TPA: DUF421 domain-containing protein [Candidatus Egerieicola faecale]|jgi:hypothetical protein|uniref:DUF421 domain-containing protein n=1 Tax=Candidatus Egerieicola faecale TaxID=2840774 RepID=A0A9D1LKX8_9FIRM|nr:DUF421 domain-containing protein [Candidatus Egerieicola faecale]